MHRDRAGAFRPGALFSLHAARPSALHDLSELARPTMEHLSELSRETVNLAVPRGGAAGPDRPGRRPLPDRRDELGRRRRARALHGAGQGALRLRRAPAAAGQPRAPHRALAGRPRPVRPRPRRGAPPRLGRLAGRAGARAHRRRRARADRRRHRRRRRVGLRTDEPHQRLRHHQARRSAGRPSSAACRRCWATNQPRRKGSA